MTGRRGVAVGGLMLAAATLVGCSGSTPAPVAPATTVATGAASAPAASTDGSHRGGASRHGGDATGSSRGAASLPADWPGLPLPPGTLDGSTGAGGSWTVRLRTSGSAEVVRRRTETFYVDRGFARTPTADVLVRGALRLVVVTENRDHSATSTVLVLGLTRT